MCIDQTFAKKTKNPIDEKSDDFLYLACDSCGRQQLSDLFHCPLRDWTSLTQGVLTKCK